MAPAPHGSCFFVSIPLVCTVSYSSTDARGTNRGSPTSTSPSKTTARRLLGLRVASASEPWPPRWVHDRSRRGRPARDPPRCARPSGAPDLPRPRCDGGTRARTRGPHAPFARVPSLLREPGRFGGDFHGRSGRCAQGRGAERGDPLPL